MEEAREVDHLVAFCGQPCNVPTREYRVEQHHSLDRSRNWRWPAKPAVRLSNRFIEPSTMEMENACATMGTPIGTRKPAMHQIPEKVVGLLAMLDVGKGSVVTVHANA
jgi:hypothetical protein